MRGYYFSWLGKGMLSLFLFLNAVHCLGNFPPGATKKLSDSKLVSAAKKENKLLNNSIAALVGHWKLDEGSGATLWDHSGLGNHARLVKPQGVTWVAGKEGLALNLPGSADRFGVAPNHASLNITDALTISAWIRPVDMNTRTILSKTNPNGYELSLNKNGKIELRINYSSSGNTYVLQSNASYPANGSTWMHVAATFDGTTSRIYINGTLDKTATYGSPVAIRTNTSGLYIGALQTSNKWKGALDDVRLYHGALTSAEVNTLVNGNTPPPAITMLSSPLNQAIDVPLNTTLTWNTVAGALNYSVQVSESQTFSPTVFIRTNITTTQVQAQGLAAGKQYYWRVHASNNAGDGPWSQAWSFTTLNQPPVIQPGAVINLQQLIASKTYQHIDLAPLFSDPENAPLTYVVSSSDPAVATVTVAGNFLQIHTLKAGDASISLKASDGTHESAPLSFRTLVYPEAKVLSANNYTFSNWDANAPEGTFPDNMIFLQSDIDVPDLAKELLYPYAIPASDYAAADAGNIGFPYRNTSRTRINGLGNDGISFINTGRGRDLGGALLAVDTRNITDAKIGFTAATLAPNFRVYNIAVLCRIGTDGQWQPVFTELEQPLVYESKTQVDSSQENLVGYLPATAIGQEYV